MSKLDYIKARERQFRDLSGVDPDTVGARVCLGDELLDEDLPWLVAEVERLQKQGGKDERELWIKTREQAQTIKRLQAFIQQHCTASNVADYAGTEYRELMDKLYQDPELEGEPENRAHDSARLVLEFTAGTLTRIESLRRRARPALR